MVLVLDDSINNGMNCREISLYYAEYVFNLNAWLYNYIFFAPINVYLHMCTKQQRTVFSCIIRYRGQNYRSFLLSFNRVMLFCKTVYTCLLYFPIIIMIYRQ